jgi:shikimate kinase
MNIFLIGFMGSGKSTTGKKLSKLLGYSFVDTDELIIDRLGMSINDIFKHLGEEKFRENETGVLNKLVTEKNLVVSTGGGLPCYGENMDIINRHGISVYLKVSPTDLYSRLSPGKYKRPLIKNLSDEELMKFIENTLSEREAYYSLAHHTVTKLDVDLKKLMKVLSG